MEKNKIYDAEILDYTAQGQGIARVEGCVVFVPGAIAGERCRVRITKVGKTWASGVIVEIPKRSPHRIARACPVGYACGGCTFQHLDYAGELELKAERVRQALCRIGGETLEAVPILPAQQREGYRNKAIYPVAEKDGRAVAGFYRGGTHEVVPCPRCALVPAEMDAVRDAVVEYMNQYHVPPYDEGTHTGLVRQIFIRRGAVSGQMLVCLVVNGRKIPKEEALLARLRAIPGFATLTLSVNTRRGNAILGEETIVLYGPGYVTDTLCGLEFRLSTRSFYQVNHDQAERLYGLAIAQAAIEKTDVVLDLYCGAGTITLAMARAAGKVIGVEVEPQAVADARENAARNGIANAEFFCGDAGQAALALGSRGIRPDVVVVDPPRKGLNADTIEALARFAPRRIVYVSCDPATLARDTALLKEKSYHLTSAQAVDMFPRCAHVETVVLMSRAKE